MKLPRLGNERRPGAVVARGLPGLDWLNFFIANFQTGFGPFISVYLTSAGWTQGAIGAALSTGTIASMASQVPAGALVDAMRSKRIAAAAAIAAIGVSALAMALWPNFLAISAAEALHSFASAVLGPAIAAMTLVLVDPSTAWPQCTLRRDRQRCGSGSDGGLRLLSGRSRRFSIRRCARHSGISSARNIARSRSRHAPTLPRCLTAGAAATTRAIVAVPDGQEAYRLCRLRSLVSTR
jgi:hypothetical protein